MTRLVKPAVKEELISVNCDKCNRSYHKDDPLGIVRETGEFFSINQTVGYYSNPPGCNFPWADGDTVRIDLCENCLFEVLGPYVKIEKERS